MFTFQFLVDYFEKMPVYSSHSLFTFFGIYCSISEFDFTVNMN